MFQLFSVALSLSGGVVLKQQQKSECTKRFHILTCLVLPSSKVSAVLGRPLCRCSLKSFLLLVCTQTYYPGCCESCTLVLLILQASYVPSSFWWRFGCVACAFLGLGHLQSWRLKHPVLCGFSCICFDLSDTRRGRNIKGRINCSTQFPVSKTHWWKI